MNKTTIARVARVAQWLDGAGSVPSEYELTTYLLNQLEDFYPERKNADGEVIEPAGVPPSHAYFHRAAKALAMICAQRGVLR